MITQKFIYEEIITRDKTSLDIPWINNNGLVALALLLAGSNPNEKELMIKLIINLINEQ